VYPPHITCMHPPPHVTCMYPPPRMTNTRLSPTHRHVSSSYYMHVSSSSYEYEEVSIRGGGSYNTRLSPIHRHVSSSLYHMHVSSSSYHMHVSSSSYDKYEAVANTQLRPRSTHYKKGFCGRAQHQEVLRFAQRVYASICLREIRCTIFF
jgi:hypothetical protein